MGARTCEQLWSCTAMNGAIHAAATEQRFVCGIHNRVNVELGDIALPAPLVSELIASSMTPHQMCTRWLMAGALLYRVFEAAFNAPCLYSAARLGVDAAAVTPMMMAVAERVGLHETSLTAKKRCKITKDGKSQRETRHGFTSALLLRAGPDTRSVRSYSRGGQSPNLGLPPLPPLDSIMICETKRYFFSYACS